MNILATTYYFHLNCLFKLLTLVDLSPLRRGNFDDPTKILTTVCWTWSAWRRTKCRCKLLVLGSPPAHGGESVGLDWRDKTRIEMPTNAKNFQNKITIHLKIANFSLFNIHKNGWHVGCRCWWQSAFFTLEKSSTYSTNKIFTVIKLQTLRCHQHHCFRKRVKVMLVTSVSWWL